MQISEIKGEQAIDVLADIIDPVTTILSDEEVRSAYYGENRMQAIKVALKKYKKEVIYVLALLDGENPKTYQPTLLTLPKKLIEITDDPDMQLLFMSAGQNEEEDSSGSAMENTEDKK